MQIRIAPRAVVIEPLRIAPKFQRVIVCTGLAALTACANTPPPTPPELAPAVVAVEEWMARGDASLKAGDQTKARAAWRSAAQDYPTAKQPWLTLSENYFNAGDYGNAVLAAQEALQRDPQDRLANSVLAVSGLRLTAASLAALRDEAGYAVGSREEAVSVTNALRLALGEPVLVPSADSGGQKRILKARPVKRSLGITDPSNPSAADPALAAPPALAPPPATATRPAGNPLDKLK